jgi:hypothetical protein
MGVAGIPSLNDAAIGALTPTDLSQFIRLEQCQRYLRLRLIERAQGHGFLTDAGVAPQSIPPLLTRSGAAFEHRVEQIVGEHFPVRNLAAERTTTGEDNDNDRVIALARDLAPGAVLVFFQPRLAVDLGRWRIRGDVDIVRLERQSDGTLTILIADMKSSTSAKVEHRLQVAFYLEMLETLLAQAGVPANIELGILYRGPGEPPALLTAEARATHDRQRDAAFDRFGLTDALLEVVEDPESYRGAVRDLVTGPASVAERVATTDFDALPAHLTYKCDGCLYNEFCMRWAAEHDDLSLLPHLTADEKAALRRGGVTTMQAMASLKDITPKDAGPRELVTAPGNESTVRQLAVSWPVGPRLDELIHRARRYRQFKGDQIEALSYIPSKGYGSLPYADADHNPNLVRVYLDAQHDYLQDRIYLLGALVVGSEHGSEPPERRRSIVHLADGPPDSLETERNLFVRFAREVVRAVAEVAAPDEDGQPNAPVHLIFFNQFEQRLLLDGLARHLTAIFEATPLYDVVTQLAAFDSPVLTYLDQEIRELKNYPMVCQSLQAVASYLKFDWNAPEPYRDLFRTRLFDYWGKFDAEPGGREENRWYTGRARFNSQIPLEYAYAAWGELPLPAPGERDEFATYRGATTDLLRGFHARRLAAMEHVAKDFPGNRQTQKRAFTLPDLAHFDGKAQTLAQALDEFVTLERHTALAGWKTTRLAPPERRVLAGDTLLVEYHEADQDPDVAAQNRENLRRFEQAERLKAASADGTLTKEQKQETRWSQDGLRVRLRLSGAGVDVGLDEMLALTTLRDGERVVVMPRTTVDTRPGADATPFTPTPKQLLYGTRAELVAIAVERDSSGAATAATIELVMRSAFGVKGSRAFIFGSMDRPFVPGERSTIDTDPNDWYGYFGMKVVEGLCAGERNALADRLQDLAAARVIWPEAAVAGQRRFLDGLDALHQVGALHDFEPSKRDYIAHHGDAPILLVQGPPGTGKSYATAFALLARLQGAMAAGRDLRAFVSCKTHAATDVLLSNIAAVQALLRRLCDTHPAIVDAFIDPRLLEVPLFRLHRPPPTDGVVQLRQKRDRQPGEPRDTDVIANARWCVVGTTPGGVYRMLKDRWNTLVGHQFCDCLVLDEASQMNLPEAMMAALALKDDAPLIVVGDHRQMPPIVKHDWASEARRTFQEFRTYESLFRTLVPLPVPLIQFEESFRLHADMAEFLRREVYAQDGIAYFSQREQTLPASDYADPFLASVLRPEQTLVVVVHDEEESIVRNLFEQGLITTILEALAAPPYELEAEHGLGVVVPHRAQRAALQQAVPRLNVVDPLTGEVVRSAVDTVERFQGDERSAIVVGATESDPQYLLGASEFLLDPRRLTVALSRAKEKLILVAARSIFSLITPDEEAFANAQLWKNLLRRTCTVPLWRGERDGRRVEVWGNQASQEI